MNVSILHPAYKHGHAGVKAHTRTYKSWQHMKKRCSDKKIHNANIYALKGISVCDRWVNSFPNFLADMGERPIGKTLDRINNSFGYSPENCKWSSPQEQAQNTARCKLNKHSAREIMALKGTGVSSTFLGKKYGVHPSRICAIWNGKAWVETNKD